ncbi:DUF1015 domain-containing protein [Thermincola potens]|uniref:DUF1015 domain-containing protein n=1 Tax=Thermincola potens (strain JR) TaxID=635013 RepID=D5XBK8_THEPJ|nr:DUF1015 domain-containing protein [Thermincola potens]ADG83437.1 conserved hypothetical protein [Thermincola potens JR]
MAVIIPFRGLRYNLDRIGDLNDVVTPPYDVIDPAGQEMFYEKSPYNIIRLELGKKYPTDTPENNRYTRAAETLRAWVEEGILVNDPKPSLYLYEQEFEARGAKKTRSGFIAGVQAEDYSKGDVLPHEETLPKHKADRLELMLTTEANFSPIFGLYADKEHKIEAILEKAKGNRPPDEEAVDSNGVINRLWVISDEEAVQSIVELMKDKKIFIADGHHRYETAVNFGKEMAARGKEGFNYLMVALVNLYNEGLVVFPTHRLVNNIADLDVDRLLAGLQENFHVEEAKDVALPQFIAELERRGAVNPSFGLYTQEGKFYWLTLKDISIVDRLDLPGHSAAWKQLDVSILHTLILEGLLGIGSKQRADESNLKYVREDDAAKAFVDSGEYQLAFFMNSTKVEEVTAIATGGEKMPQKSTFFYPKVITGMVMNNYKK